MRLTLSKAALPLYCTWPFVEGREPPNVPRPKMRFNLLGHAFHMVVASLINDGEYNPVSAIKHYEIPGDTDETAGDIISMFPWDRAQEVKDAHPDVRAEVAYAFDPKTGRARELGVNIDRQYEGHGLLPHEIPGSLDVVWTENNPADMSRVVVYRDWKVVFGKALHVMDVEANPQMRFGALCAMRVTGAGKARLEISQVGEHGDHHVRDATITQMQAMKTVHRVLKNVSEANADTLPRPGRHCVDHYCPMMGICPATHEAISACAESVTQLPTRDLPIVVDPSRIQSDAHAAFLLQIVRHVDRAAVQMRSALEQYVRNVGHHIPTGNGMEWGPSKQNRAAIFHKSIEELAQVIGPFVGGESQALSIIRAGVTKKQLEGAISNVAPKGKVAPSVQACHEELDKAGMLVHVHCDDRFSERKIRAGE